jgi:hypothetical protein
MLILVYLYGLHAVYMSLNKLDDLTTYVKIFG